MYNLVYDAIKSVRPDAKIGGPYVSVGSTAPYASLSPAPGSMDQGPLNVITSWLANKKGADFIALDGGPGPIDQARGCGVTNEFAAGQFYMDIVNWIRAQPGGQTLPIGWTEWYPCTAQSISDLNHINAVVANDGIFVIKSGAFYALPWGVQNDIPEGIMDGSGQPTPLFNTFKALKDNFPPGTQLYKTTVAPFDVTVLASKAKTMLVNHLGTNQTVNVNGTPVNLTAYQVLVINTPGGGVNPTAQPSSVPTSMPTNAPNPTYQYATPPTFRTLIDSFYE